MPTPVLVLGASGMLGATVCDVLGRDSKLSVTGTTRTPASADDLRERGLHCEWRVLDAETASVASLADLVRPFAWVINAIGVIKPYIHDDNPAEVERAVRVNTLFPHTLAKAAEQAGAEVIQIATDCVYAGLRGRYSEADPHDPLDVYGKTKSLGEVRAPRIHHLRCSVIGPEPKAHVSLLDWFLGQASGSRVCCYTNHQWNGVTALHFARVCGGIVHRGLDLPHVQHLVPSDTVSKHELLQAFAREFGRNDVVIHPTAANTVVNRTLITTDPGKNAELWSAAGYATLPTVAEMVAEMAHYNFRFRR